MKKLKTSFKFLFLLSALFSVVTFMGCNNDDDENPDDSTSNTIVGLWTISDAEVDASIGGQSLVEFIAEQLGISEEEASAFADLFNGSLLSEFVGTIEFKADNTYITNIGDETDDGTWMVNSAGDQITLDAGTIDQQVVDIVSLTSNKLVVSLEQTEDIDIDDDELTPDVSVDMVVVLTLTK